MAAVDLIQYVMPDGHKRLASCEVTDENAERAERMVLFCEVLTTGQVALYGRFRDEDAEDEITMIADNTVGDSNSPTAVVNKVIEAVWKRRNAKS